MPRIDARLTPGRVGERAALPAPGGMLLLYRQLVEGIAHRDGSIITSGSDTLPGGAALQGDEPSVDAWPGGVDPNGVAPVPRRPEPMAGMLLGLVLHYRHAQDHTAHLYRQTYRLNPVHPSRYDHEPKNRERVSATEGTSCCLYWEEARDDLAGGESAARLTDVVETLLLRGRLPSLP